MDVHDEKTNKPSSVLSCLVGYPQVRHERREWKPPREVAVVTSSAQQLLEGIIEEIRHLRDRGGVGWERGGRRG